MKEEFKKQKRPTFIESLKLLIQKTEQQQEVEIQDILKTLNVRGYAAILVIFSFPFCFPFTIPGFSAPFGLLLAFIGLRIAFGNQLWLPQWILVKKVSSSRLNKLLLKICHLMEKFQKFFKPRLIFLIQYRFFMRLHGVLIFVLGILLALPLPVPLTNTMAAAPLVCLGIGILEDDGFAIIAGYLLALLCFAFFAGLFFFGKALFT